MKKKTLYFNVDSASSTLVRKHVYEDNVKQAEQEGWELDSLKSGQGRNHCKIAVWENARYKRYI